MVHAVGQAQHKFPSQISLLNSELRKASLDPSIYPIQHEVHTWVILFGTGGNGLPDSKHDTQGVPCCVWRFQYLVFPVVSRECRLRQETLPGLFQVS
jgi:hypothetical protein